jgi:hypothetical protein
MKHVLKKYFWLLPNIGDALARKREKESASS